MGNTDSALEMVPDVHFSSQYMPDYNSAAENSDNSVALALDFDSTRQQLVAHFEERKYDVYYMDLYADEIMRVQQIFSGERELLFVNRQCVIIDDNQLSIRRFLSLPADQLPSNVSTVNGSEFVACSLSSCGNLLVKFGDGFYFAGESFINEYKYILERSRLPHGTSVRIRSERIVADSTEHIFDVMPRKVDFQANQRMVVIEALGNVEPCWRSLIADTSLKRYMRIPFERKFCWLPIELIYSESDGSCDELYAEADYIRSLHCMTAIPPIDPQPLPETSVSHSNGNSANTGSAGADCTQSRRCMADIPPAYSLPIPEANGVPSNGFRHPMSIKNRTVDIVADGLPQNRKRIRSYAKYFVPGDLRKIQFMLLKEYHVDRNLVELMKHDFKINANTELSEEAKDLYQKIWRFKNEKDWRHRLQPSNYNELFSLILEMEDEYDRRQALAYNQTNAFVYLVEDMGNRFPNVKFAYSIKLEYEGDGDVLELFEELFNRNSIFELNICPMIYERHEDPNAYAKWIDQNYGTLKSNGHVLLISRDILYFTTTEPLDLRSSDQLFYVHFFHNRTTYRMNRQALDFMECHKVYDVFFPDGNFEHDDDYVPRPEAGLLSTSFLNNEQHLAISNIVNKVSYPLPFILYGPPGTGKTMTIIEAIAQIVKNTDEKVLLCSSSNFACDALAARLLHIDAVAEKQCVYRLYSKSTDPSNIPAFVKRISNFYDIDNIKDGFYPDLSFLVQFQVIVCTLTTAGRLTQANIGKNYPELFSYVIIDECACATEPGSITPIAGICTSADRRSLTAQVVLAGDPRQLRPVIRCDMASCIGLATSLMDRMMRSDPYRKHPITKQFNKRYIIQLLNNYRSHREILRFPNETFYDGTIISKGLQSDVCRYINTEILPSPQIPIIFKSVQGSSQSLFKYSICNYDEVDHVVAYIRQLIGGYVLPQYRGDQENTVKRKKMLPIGLESIGVIATYRAQCKVLRKRFTGEGWKNLKVGTVDSFQGEEKLIIVASTVRSKSQNAAFLNDSRRLNVLITRAKGLLVIVGDPFTLKNATCWKRFLRFLQDNNAIIQSEDRFMLMNDGEKNKK